MLPFVMPTTNQRKDSSRKKEKKESENKPKQRRTSFLPIDYLKESNVVMHYECARIDNAHLKHIIVRLVPNALITWLCFIRIFKTNNSIILYSDDLFMHCELHDEARAGEHRRTSIAHRRTNWRVFFFCFFFVNKRGGNNGNEIAYQ